MRRSSMRTIVPLFFLAVGVLVISMAAAPIFGSIDDEINQTAQASASYDEVSGIVEVSGTFSPVLVIIVGIVAVLAAIILIARVPVSYTHLTLPTN